MGYIVFQHNDHDDLIDGKSYLSLYSFPQLSLIQSHILPTYENDKMEMVGSHCNGFYFFTDFEHNFVIINLTTKEFKPLPPLPELEPPPSLAIFHACGIGRDPDSGVYKILLAYTQHLSKIDSDGHVVHYDYENRALLYSFDTDSWTWIHCNIGFTADHDSVYFGHKRYWTALIHRKQPVDHHVSSLPKSKVLSFNFRTERFTAFPLPPYPPGAQYYQYNLVKYGEMLGTIGYSGHEASMDYEIWVREGKSWRIVHTISFGRVERALALRDEQFLFFAVPCVDDDERSELCVVDVVGGGLPRTLNIYGQQYKLRVLPFDENLCPLPGGQPSIKSYSDDEDEEIGKKMKRKKKSYSDDEDEEIGKKMKKKKKKSSKKH